MDRSSDANLSSMQTGPHVQREMRTSDADLRNPVTYTGLSNLVSYFKRGSEEPVTPRSGGHRDVSAAYIRRTEIPSRIYAKYQYGKNQSTEARGALYIPIYKYNYKAITGCDTILQEYYITDRHKCENTK